MDDFELTNRARAAYNRLGWAIDRRDWDAVTAALADEVTLDYTELFGGEVSTSTGRQVAEQWRDTLGGLDGTQHVITGSKGRIGADGSRTATANVVAAHVHAADPANSPWVIGGWYEATFELAGDELTVSTLTLHATWQTGSKDIRDAG